MKALITHFSFATIGGAERVALKIAAFLRDDLKMDVEVLCFDAPDTSRLQAQFGLSPGNGITFTELKSPFGVNLQLFKIARLHRISRRIANGYDLCISTYNEQDFGRPALQYVHHPIFESRKILRRYKIIPRENIIDRFRILEKIYYGLLNLYSGSDVAARRKNVTLTNSGFMAGILNDCGYNNVQVLYPGFLEDGGIGSKSQKPVKKHQIFSLGRIEPDKHTLELVRLYKVLHTADPSLRLLICGLTGSADYLAEVKTLIHELNIPIELVLDQDRASVMRLINESKYYINPKPYEHFGIATVEAIEAGCIPLVHNSGGNQELVRYNVLRFEHADELGRNFIQINRDTVLQKQILDDLETGLEKYSSATFFKLFHEITRLYLKDTRVRI